MGRIDSSSGIYIDKDIVAWDILVLVYTEVSRQFLYGSQ